MKSKLKIRNPYAEIAQFRNSSGAMKDLKKEKNKNLCRDKSLENNPDLEYDDGIKESDLNEKE